jgi:hypothetical protein
MLAILLGQLAVPLPHAACHGGEGKTSASVLFLVTALQSVPEDLFGSPVCTECPAHGADLRITFGQPLIANPHRILAEKRALKLAFPIKVTPRFAYGDIPLTSLFGILRHVSYVNCYSGNFYPLDHIRFIWERQVFCGGDVAD